MKKVLIIIIAVLINSLVVSLKAHENKIQSESQNEIRKEKKPVKPFQFSIVPGLSTAGVDARNIRYQLSLNAFIGNTGGVQGLEAGGFMNINSGEVEGMQVAGFGNIVSGDIKGMQGSGFINVINGNTDGVIGTGFMNIVNGNSKGAMGSGFMNIIRNNAETAMGSGFANIISGDFNGVSGAGFMNVVRGKTDGVTLAGFANIHNSYCKGVQVAGFANFSKEDVDGPQISGFMNTANKIKGLQAAGFINIAKDVEGVQLGFINICDTISGVPVGFLSIVKNGGIRQFEFSVSDGMIAGFSFKIGVPFFYNIFSFGYTPFNDNISWASGFGFGTNLFSGKNSGLQLEGHSYNFYKNVKLWKNYETNMLNEFRILYSYKLNNSFEIYLGPVFYNQIINEYDSYTFNDLSIAPYTIYKHTTKNGVYNFWAGARSGIRLIIR